jgi:hypothetical protein
MRKTSRISVGNPERKGPVGRLRRIWNNSIKKCFKDVLYENWTVFITQEQALVNIVMNVWAQKWRKSS